MGFYEKAQEQQEFAELGCNAGKYSSSVYMSILSIENYLKSTMHLVDKNEEFVRSHNVVGMYKLLVTKYKPSVEVEEILAICRENINDSRYDDNVVYDKEFAYKFLENVKIVKAYIDNECSATFNDLKNKFNKPAK